MNRSGYVEDDGDPVFNLYRGRVVRALRGARGQAALREIAAALDAMPDKSLCAQELQTADGEFCTLGVLGHARGIDLSKLDPEDWDAVAKALNLAPSMVREIEEVNDEGTDTFKFIEVEICGPMQRFESHFKTAQFDFPAAQVAASRWKHMREWVQKQILSTPAAMPEAAMA